MESITVDSVLRLEKRIYWKELNHKIAGSFESVLKPLLRKDNAKQDLCEDYSKLAEYLDAISKDKKASLEYVDRDLNRIVNTFKINLHAEGLKVRTLITNSYIENPPQINNYINVVYATDENLEAAARIVSKISKLSKEKALKIK